MYNPNELNEMNQNLDQDLNNELPTFGAYTMPEEEAPFTPQPDPTPVYAVPLEPRQTIARRKAERKNGRLGAKIVALALCCSLLGGALGAGGMALLASRNAKNTAEARRVSNLVEGQRETGILNVAKLDTSALLTPAEVYAANVNSTVGITTSVTSTNFWGYQTTAAASGSGFIISDDGYILTNYHVIEDADSVTVTQYDNATYEAELIGYDESNDIAVLKIDATGLTPVVLGNSDDLHVGDSVLAIGNPLGELTFSLTSGAVSALDREITMSNGLTMDLIQTDCAINSGNSGGALFNLYGEVVGITNAKYSGSGSGEASIDNIGFAIPINTVRGIVESLIEKGYISKPFIGVKVSTVSEDAQLYGLPQGAAVREVTEDGPAAKAGLQANDIITAVNGTEITSDDALVRMVASAQVGDEFKLTVYRQNETLELTLTVGEKIQQAKEQPDRTRQGAQRPQSGGQMIDPFSYFFGY